MRFDRFCWSVAGGALLLSGVGCKKNEPQPAASAPEQAAPAEASAAPTEPAAPAPEPAATAPPQVSAPPPAQPVAPVTTTSSLRGSAEVMAALNRKDYAAAVGLLSGVKAGLKEDQRLEYNNLLWTVRNTIYEAKSTSPSAKAAWEAMRRIEAGR
jgi:hypothetical protein